MTRTQLRAHAIWFLGGGVLLGLVLISLLIDTGCSNFWPGWKHGHSGPKIYKVKDQLETHHTLYLAKLRQDKDHNVFVLAGAPITFDESIKRHKVSGYVYGFWFNSSYPSNSRPAETMRKYIGQGYENFKIVTAEPHRGDILKYTIIVHSFGLDWIELELIW